MQIIEHLSKFLTSILVEFLEKVRIEFYTFLIYFSLNLSRPYSSMTVPLGAISNRERALGASEYLSAGH